MQMKTYEDGALQLLRHLDLGLGEGLDPIRPPRRRRVTAAIAASSWVGGPKGTSLAPLRDGRGSATWRPPSLSTRACFPPASSPEAGAFSSALSGTDAGSVGRVA